MKLRTVHPDLFDARFPERCRLEHCRSGCCRHGAWIDPTERERILRERAHVAPWLREEARDPDSWFGEARADPDYPSGTCVETREIGGACAFFHPGHGCALQRAAAARGLHEWDWKPRFCILFPLVVEGGTLQVDEAMQSLWCLQPHNRTRPVLEAVEREVRHLFGDEAAQRLLAAAGSGGRS